MVLYNIFLKHRILDREMIWGETDTTRQSELAQTNGANQWHTGLCLTIPHSGLIHSKMNIYCVPTQGMLCPGDRHKISSHDSSSSIGNKC